MSEALSLSDFTIDSAVEIEAEDSSEVISFSLATVSSLAPFCPSVSLTVIIFCSLLKNLGARLTNAFPWFVWTVLPSTAEVAADASLS